MDSIPWEKAKLSEFGKNRTACLRKSHPDEGQVPQQRRKMRRPHLTTIVCLDVIRLSFFELGAGPAVTTQDASSPLNHCCMP